MQYCVMSLVVLQVNSVICVLLQNEQGSLKYPRLSLKNAVWPLSPVTMLWCVILLW